MAALTITAIIERRGVNPFVAISRRGAEQIKPGWRRPMPVLVTINDETSPPWRTNMMPEGDGSFVLYLHGQMRRRAAVDFDDSYRNGPLHPVPEWFRVELAANPTALEKWAALTPSRQKEILRYFAALKSDVARDRNAIRVISALTAANERFLGRDWVDGA